MRTSDITRNKTKKEVTEGLSKFEKAKMDKNGDKK